jgi:hypothetical protein
VGSINSVHPEADEIKVSQMNGALFGFDRGFGYR